MTRKYFGTDGIRGRANQGHMTADMAMRVAAATGRFFERKGHQPRVVIAKDTRLSGYMIESAMQAGFVSVGVDVMLLGPVPTPAVGMLTRSMRADLGVMISASHNGFADNGIKLFGPDGFKLSDDHEREIECLIEAPIVEHLVDSTKIGRARRIDDAAARYIESVKASVPRQLSLEGLRIVIDCAHGAAYKVAPTVLWELGAEIIGIGVAPNGTNINENCGSTSLAAVKERVRDSRADLGIALDGDADRVILIDEHGAVIDGDQLMAAIAIHWSRHNRLAHNKVAATIMSNLGFERCLHHAGIELIRTKVGDRYVVEAMRQHGLNLGGEQSGHVVMTDYATTGDGLLAALQLLMVLRESGASISKVASQFTPVPQILRNARFGAQDPLAHDDIQQILRDAEDKLGDRGRLVVRKSGTEPVIRVMAEGDDAREITTMVEAIVARMEALV